MTFGDFLKEMIKKEGITQQAFYTAAGIGKPYFYDILSGKICPPPFDVQERMAKALKKMTVKERNTLYDIAAKGRGEIPGDIAKMISDNPSDIDNIRKILDALLVSRTIKIN